MFSEFDNLEFESDNSNQNKIHNKHGLEPDEIEKSFFDKKQIILADTKHYSQELRFILLGKNLDEKLLYICFTVRGKKIRIISARKADKKEHESYRNQN